MDWGKQSFKWLLGKGQKGKGDAFPRPSNKITGTPAVPTGPRLGVAADWAPPETEGSSERGAERAKSVLGKSPKTKFKLLWKLKAARSRAQLRGVSNRAGKSHSETTPPTHGTTANSLSSPVKGNRVGQSLSWARVSEKGQILPKDQSS